MRSVKQYPNASLFNVSTENHARLTTWFSEEYFDAISARNRIDNLWRELLRMYDGVPKTQVKNTPIENAPNLEVTIGASATDTAYAQMLDLIYTISPLVTVRELGASGQWTKHAKALQKLANYLPRESGLRPASEHAIFDCNQLGTGFYYIPFVEDVTKTHSYEITNRRPVIYAMAPEDVLMPGGAREDLQTIPWIGLRFYHTKSEIETYAKYRNWDISKFSPTIAADWVRHRRERLSRTTANVARHNDLYEVQHVFAHFDIDGDGIAEDIQFVYDVTSQAIGHIRYMPYDCRPVEKMCYQIRPHMAYGVGVMEMVAPYQEEMTELHNHQLLNVLLANCRLWKARYGAVKDGTMTIFPNKLIEMANPEDLVGEQLADIYDSLPMTQQMVAALAEQRVGLNNLVQPRQSQVFGNRTPGVTATSLLQQVNKRFTPAFDAVRIGTSNALMQCLYRYSERIRDGDMEIESHIKQVCGDADGALVIELLGMKDFANNVTMELTASSASINRDADRQNMIMLANMLGQYYEKSLQLMTIASNPQVPKEVRDVAMKISVSSGELIDRVVRTFDQVRDPSTFVLSMEGEIASSQEMADQTQMTTLLSSLATMGGQPPAGVPPGGG